MTLHSYRRWRCVLHYSTRQNFKGIAKSGLGGVGILAIVSTILACIFPSSLHALDPQRLLSQYTLEVWNTDKGMPSGTIMAIAQTPDRYIWLGTFSGLVRFDGVRFTVFNSTNTPAITNNTIWTAYTDVRGSLWLGTNGGGLVQYRNGIFTRFTSNNGLPSDIVRSIGEDSSGTLWVGTVKGLCSLKVKAKEHITNEGILFSGVRLPTESGVQPTITALLGNEQGVWVATDGLGAYCIAKNSTQYYGRTSGLPSDVINDIFQDREHQIWVGTARGYSVLQAQAHGMTVIHTAMPEYNIRRIRQDRDGNVWLATSSGLFRLVGGNPDSAVSGFPAENDLAKTNFNTLMEDTEGTVWIGSYTSLGLMCLRDGALLPFGAPEGIPDDVIFGVVELHDANETVWFGGYGGIAEYSRRTGALRRFMPGGTEKPRATANLIRALLRRHDGSLWAASYGAGVFRFDGNKFVNVLTTKNGLSNDIVRCLHEDSHHALWCGTRNGLTKVDSNGVRTVYTTQNGLPHNSIMHLFEDSQKRLWVATDGGGVVCMNGEEKTLYSVKNGLASDVVFYMYEDAEGTMWITTNAGITRIKGGVCTSLRGSDGLPSENIYQIIYDKHGNVWFGCAIGIMRMSVAHLSTMMDAKARGERVALEYRMFGKSDGMRAVDCTVPANLCQTEKGIWFPTLKGALFLDSRYDAHGEQPPVYIQAMECDGAPLVLKESIDIQAGARQFTIDYTALSFNGVDNVRFKYRLMGIDNNWLDVGKRRTAYYTNLPPGDYTFHVIACNANGLWNTSGAALHFRVAPHFWQTYWFYALCVGAMIASGWGLARYQVVRVRYRNELLKKLVDERTTQLSEANRELEAVNQEISRQNEILSVQASDIEIFTTGLQEKNLALEELNQEKNEFLGIAAHDLKNPLTQITMTTSTLHRYFSRFTQEQILEKLRGIEDGARRMTDIITNLLDVNRIESGLLTLDNQELPLNLIAEELVSAYLDPATAKNISLHYSSSPTQAMVFADKQILEAIIDNLLSNAVKYSPHGKRVFIRILNNGEWVRVEVEDEGQGISQEDMKKLFGKFARLSARPTGGENSTGLGLSIVKKMVEALNGKVWCESEEGQGATFIVELPSVSAPDLAALS
jgi:signal transduction histidine kinase/ligand-binding sensor domain-containing protein